jgi:hypothetical protein
LRATELVIGERRRDRRQHRGAGKSPSTAA